MKKITLILILVITAKCIFAQNGRFEKEKLQIDYLDSIDLANEKNDPKISTSLIYEYTQILKKVEGKNSDLEPYLYFKRGLCYHFGLSDYNGAIKDYTMVVSFNNKNLTSDMFYNLTRAQEWRTKIYYNSIGFRAVAFFEQDKFEEGCKDIRIVVENLKDNQKWVEYLKYCR